MEEQRSGRPKSLSILIMLDKYLLVRKMKFVGVLCKSF